MQTLPTARTRTRRWPWLAVAGLLVVLAGETVLLASRWPFTQERLARSLAGATSSDVRFGAHRMTFFPRPGCVVGEVTFSRAAGDVTVPLAVLRTLTIEGSWPALLTFTRRLERMRLEGLRVRLPADAPPAKKGGTGSGLNVAIGELTAHGALLEIAREEPDAQPLRFEFPELAVRDVRKGKPVQFRTTARIPEPPGELQVTGTFGPWDASDPGRTSTAGSFQLRRADLGRYKGLAGLLDADGSFRGELARVEVRGQVKATDFAVNRNRHALPVSATVEAVVNGLNGDTLLPKVEARFLRTLLTAHGRVAGVAGQPGKTLALEITGREAHVEDLLRVFTRAERPAMRGPIVLQTKAVLPSEGGEFIQRVRLDGDFQIRNARFSKAQTQRTLEGLSARAQGDKIDEEEGERPARVHSHFAGRVALRGGVARLTQVSFQVPGAVALGGGVYNLKTKRVDLRGKLSMEASLSEATSGWKSILIRPLNFLYRKKNTRTVLPVRLSGRYPRARFQVSLTGKR